VPEGIDTTKSALTTRKRHVIFRQRGNRMDTSWLNNPRLNGRATGR
jgi:hypothetical protein